MSALASHLKIPGAVLFVVTIVAYAAHYTGPAPRYYPPPGDSAAQSSG